MGTPYIKQLAIGPMQNFAYLVGDAGAKKVGVIDPGWEPKKIIDRAHKEAMEIVSILITHTHFDHIQELEALVRLVRVPVYIHQQEAHALPRSLSIVQTTDGTKIPIGDVTVVCHHFPGHSPGLQGFSVDGHLFTGDALFVDSCGRVDLPGSNVDHMASTLKRIAKFPPETVVYPGHDYGSSPTSTIGEQLKTNPYLKAGCRLS